MGWSHCGSEQLYFPHFSFLNNRAQFEAPLGFRALTVKHMLLSSQDNKDVKYICNMKWATTLSTVFHIRCPLKMDFSHFVWNFQFKLWPCWIPWPSKSGALWLTWSFVAPLVFSAILLKWRTWRRQIVGQVLPYIYLCASQSIKKKEKCQEEERKCKQSTKPNKKTQTIGNKEKKKEIFSANTCFLKNTICVWKTQSCLIAIYLRESCLVFHSSLRKHVKMFPWEHGF